MSNANKKRAFKKKLPLTIMALPGIVFIFVFDYIPLYGLVLPFKNFNVAKGFFKSPWSGIENFRYLFRSSALWNATRNTILYNLAFILIGTTVCVLLATFLFELGKKAVKIYQTVLLLPYFISWVVASYIVQAFLNYESGVVNSLLDDLGLEKVLWYNNPTGWPIIIMIAYLWKNIGYNMIVYYAALMGLDMECFEAARIDGAGWWQQLRYITIPGIKNVVMISIILAVGKILYGDFGLFYNVTMNSSLLYPATDVVDTLVYRMLLDLGDIGMSAASGFVQSVLGFVLTITVNSIVNKINPENALF